MSSRWEQAAFLEGNVDLDALLEGMQPGVQKQESTKR
jgi:hypothetical protein